MKANPRGQAAEEAACLYLQKQGCRIIARNWHCRFGEIDIIAQDHNCIAFIEVRHRSSQSHGGAAASITPTKLAKLTRSSECWLQQNPQQHDCRLDALLTDNLHDWQWLKNIGM